MTSIKEFQEQLLPDLNKSELIRIPFRNPETDIIVLKQYRFYKQLSVELYTASLTKKGSLKSPLTPVDPINIALAVNQTDELKFFTAVARFQNNPTASKTQADIEALKHVFRNPLRLKIYYHDHQLSEKVSVKSLKQVHIGDPITDIILSVIRKGNNYLVMPEIIIRGESYGFDKIDIKYDFVILIGKTIHLLTKFPLLKIARFFRQFPSGLELSASEFEQFHRHVLTQLGDIITIVYTYIETSKAEPGVEEAAADQMQKLVYLSDLRSYVIINPVMRYGTIEIPILTKRQIFTKDQNGNIIAVTRNDDEEINFTAMLLKQHPDFQEQLEYDPPYFYLHKQRLLDEDWFLNAFEQWRQDGITVLGFNKLQGNKLNSHKAQIHIKVTSGLDWFNTSLDVSFGKKKASLKQLHQSVRNNNKFVQLDDGTLGILPTEWLQKFESYFKNSDISGEMIRTPKSNFLAIKETYAADELDERVKEEIKIFESKLANFNGLGETPVPTELNANLREYQKQGLNWLNLLDDFNFGGCLADDMGLGKTIQVLAFILLLRQKHKQAQHPQVTNTSLVVVPTSLIFNWQAEVEKFAPSISLFTLYGNNRVKDVNELNSYDLVLTSYGTLLSAINYLKDFPFNYIFLDESQNIKNVESQRYQTVIQLKSRNKIAITGTPVENNTLDLYAQLSFACPGLLGNKQSFKDLFSIPIDKFKSSRNATELKQIVAPFILRRTKKQVAQELPDKTEMTLYCPMGEAQRKVYNAYEKEFRDFISGLTDEEILKSAVNVLKVLTRLRQICDSPLLLEDEKLYSDRSSKIDVLIEEILNRSVNHKILIFSQFVSMLELIKKELDQLGINYEYFTGKTRDREAVVNNFQSNPDTRVMLISLKAGGTGLNLTEADYIYLVDPWWNPAVENQAIDRSYRIGQKKNVVAVRLICPGTVEEKMVKLQESKKTLSDDLIKDDSPLFKSMTKSDWLALLNR